MQGSRWVFSELRPRGNMKRLWAPCRKNSRHKTLNATLNTLDIMGHLTTYWFLRIELTTLSDATQEGKL